MKSEKLPDWQARLARYVAGASQKNFRPGEHDCALFAAGAVYAQTGVDFSERWGGYRSLASGRELLKAGGFSTHVDLVASLLEEVPVLRARVGDVAVADGEGGEALGIVQGASVYVVGLQGLMLVPLTDAKRVFRV